MNGHRIKLYLSTEFAFPSMHGWFKFAWGGYWYYINIVRPQIYRFSVRPNGACKGVFKGMHNFCGTGKVSKGQGSAGFRFGFGGVTYQLIPTKLTWGQAENNCKKLGGHLATITSRNLDNHLVSQMKKR